MENRAAIQKRKVHLISLGCARNRVDSEVMLGHLFGEGWTHSEDPAVASAIIVNTCGFINAAKEESIDTILEAAEHKKTNPDLKLVVTGCLTQRYKRQLVDSLPEVDFFVGTDEFTKIASILENPPAKGSIFARRTHYLYDDKMPRINTLSQYSAYVKVAEGCQHQCSFCIIPAIRGKLRSRTVASIIDEVSILVQKGVLEINLIAQDLSAFGRDRNQDELLDLLKSLAKIEGLKWIRLLYMYPENINDEFLEFFASEPKLVKYLDIPMQHASNKILQLMKRDVDRDQLLNIIEKVRTKIPGIAIRTSVMAGFPGETEEDFQDLLSFVKKVKFDHLGCFVYSQEEGTVAGKMSEQIPEETKQKRCDEVMIVQQQISFQGLKKYVGQKVDVLVNQENHDVEGGPWVGRMSTQAPEVDGLVYITGNNLKVGTIYSVEITASGDYDLFGRVVS